MKRDSQRDLGRDSPVLCLHCHQSFCPTETSRTSFELLVSSSRPSCSPRGTERFQTSERFSGRLLQRIWSVRLPTALRSAPTSNRSFLVSSHSCRTPFSQRCHCQCRPSIFRHACVFGQTVEQALTVSDHSDGQVLLSPVRQAKLFSQSQPHTTLLACFLPGPAHLDMHWLQPQKWMGWFVSKPCSSRS